MPIYFIILRPWPLTLWLWPRITTIPSSLKVIVCSVQVRDNNSSTITVFGNKKDYVYFYASPVKVFQSLRFMTVICSSYRSIPQRSIGSLFLNCVTTLPCETQQYGSILQLLSCILERRSDALRMHAWPILTLSRNCANSPYIDNRHMQIWRTFPTKLVSCSTRRIWLSVGVVRVLSVSGHLMTKTYNVIFGCMF